MSDLVDGAGSYDSEAGAGPQSSTPGSRMGESRPYRSPRPIPPNSPAISRGGVAEQRLWLDRLRAHHIDLVNRFLSTADGAIYSIDLFLSGVATRSYHLVDGFLSLLDEWNIVAAAPLVRMQIDNLSRVAYCTRALRSDDVADAFIAGTEFRRMKAPDGEKLTDRKLIEMASDIHSWIVPVYEATSGWVHLSPLHVQHTWSVTDDSSGDDHTLIGRIPLQPEMIPTEAFLEAIGAMTQATEELFGYFEAWEQRKGLPIGQVRRVGPETAMTQPSV